MHIANLKNSFELVLVRDLTETPRQVRHSKRKNCRARIMRWCLTVIDNYHQNKYSQSALFVCKSAIVMTRCSIVN